MRKVLIVTGSLYNSIGGPYHSVRSTCQAINRAGYHVTVLGTRDRKDQKLYPDHYIKQGSLARVIALPKIGPYNWHFSLNIGTYWKAVKNSDLLSIQGVWMLNCMIVAFLARISRKPYYVAVRGEFSSESELRRPHKKLMKPLVLNLFKGAKFVQVLNVNEEQAIRNYGYHGDIRLIPNGIDSKEEERILEPKKKQILYLGRLHPDKGIAELIKSWLRFEHSEWGLIIAGSGANDYLQELKALAGANESISFSGPVYDQEKESLLIESKWLILPSLREGMPMSVLEAISYGTPVLISQQCNLQQIVDNNAGLLIEPDPQTLYNCLKLVFKLDDKSYETFRNNAIHLSNTEFNWDKLIKELFDEL